MITPDDIQDCKDLINQIEEVIIKNMSLISPDEASFILVSLGSKIAFDHSDNLSDPLDLLNRACITGKNWSDGTLDKWINNGCI